MVGGSVPGQDTHKNQEMAGRESQATAKCSDFKELWCIWETEAQKLGHSAQGSSPSHRGWGGGPLGGIWASQERQDTVTLPLSHLLHPPPPPCLSLQEMDFG